MKRAKQPSNRYYLSAHQMAESKHIEDICKSLIKRGEIKNYKLHSCSCGCGVFYSCVPA